MSNQRFQNAVARISQKVPPVWFMRQAGRYHQHYQKLRAKHSFMELCKNPELAMQVALGPIEGFDFDVSILFSDLLFPLEAMGMGLTYGDGGPALSWHLTPANIMQLKTVGDALPSLLFQKEAVKLTRQALPSDKSLIGFVGGPWTLFTYAVQGGHDGNLVASKTHIDLFKPFCEILVPLLIENIQLQFDGGAELVMLFDTAAGELAPSVYEEFVVPQLQKLASHYPKKLGYYSKMTQSEHLKNELFSSGQFAGLGFDHRWNIAAVLKNSNAGTGAAVASRLITKTSVTPAARDGVIGGLPLAGGDAVLAASTGFIQGNFDQALLFQEPDTFKKSLMKYLSPLRDLPPEQRAGWVCGLGHGVLPKTPEANVAAFVQTVREVLA